jgi:hypothetical protein
MENEEMILSFSIFRFPFSIVFLFSLHLITNLRRKQIYKARFACNKKSKGKVNDEKASFIFCDGGDGVDGWKRR